MFYIRAVNRFMHRDKNASISAQSTDIVIRVMICQISVFWPKTAIFLKKIAFFLFVFQRVVIFLQKNALPPLP
jgi:hypothetical protein